MTDQQATGFPPQEAGWVFAVPPPARCNTGRLPYPLVVKGPRPITGNQQSPDNKRWQYTITRHAVYFEETEITEWVESNGVDGLGPFGSGMLVFDNLSTFNSGIYNYRVVLFLLDKESGIIERLAVVKSDNFSVERGFNNSRVQLTYQTKEEARKAIIESPLPKRPRLLQQFRGYLH